MKIKALRNYLDTQLNRNISAGEVYEVEKARGEYIIANGFAEAYKEAKAKTLVEELGLEEPTAVPTIKEAEAEKVEVKQDGKKTSKKKK